MMSGLGLCLLLVALTATSQSLNIEDCHKELGGAAGGALPDAAFSASSSYDEASVGPQNARLHGDQNGGAWCSASPVSRELGAREWIEVDLGQMHVVTAVLTQGRFGNGRGAEYTEAYKLDYWRPGMTDFIQYHDSIGRTIMPGNDNTYSVANNTLDPPIFAQKIRLLPFSEHPRTPCIRLEYVGCPFQEGVVSYSIPQGMVRGSTLELMDHTYDGKEDPRTGDLRGGLGQLVDGHYGRDNFKAGGQGVKGYEWLGWKKKAGQNSLNLVFAFDVVRSFDRVDIHVNNHFSKDIQVFRQARAYFSNEEDKFSDDRAVDFNYMPDLAIENARNVSINLKNEHGKYVMLQLYFNAKWILISEVTFFSKPKKVEPFVLVAKTDQQQQQESQLEQTQHHTVEVAPIDIRVETESKAEEAEHSSTVGIVIGLLLTLILVLIMGILLVMHRSRASKASKGSTPTHSLITTSTKCDRSSTSMDKNLHYTPYSAQNLVNTTATTTATEETIYEEPHHFFPIPPPPPPIPASFLSTEDLTDEYAEPGGSLHISNSLNETIYAQALPVMNPSGLPPLPLRHYARPSSPDPEPYEPIPVSQRHFRRVSASAASPTSSSSATSTPTKRYRTNGRHKSGKSSRTSTLRKKQESILPMLESSELAHLYAQVDKTTSEHGSLLPFKRSASIDTVNVTLQELALEDLQVQEKLGEGQFGEIHLCRLDGGQADFGTDLVAVKFLHQHCGDETRSDFEHEARILTSLRDPNLVRVLGVCYEEDEKLPICMVCEYTLQGDLCQFLQDHVAETTLSKSPNVPKLSYGCLIYIASQIASGMKYLESLNFVHRDLAARNCLVGQRKQIKICDFGMSRALYKNDYYRTESGCMLPIRWMAWESVLLGKFTTKSDVWAFGVTLWEVLTFAREQPYESQSDAKVLSSLSNMWREGKPSIKLTTPHGCPREVRDLMAECLQRDEKERPSFSEIHLFLQRKNLGFDPDKLQ